MEISSFKQDIQIPFTEQAITFDPDWIRGVQWGKPRPGHPEE